MILYKHASILSIYNKRIYAEKKDPFTNTNLQYLNNQ
jgi:hypothetical protein